MRAGEPLLSIAAKKGGVNSGSAWAKMRVEDEVESSGMKWCVPVRSSMPKSDLGDQKLCFEVPIYRCTEHKHGDDMAKDKARFLGPLSRDREKTPHSYATAERRFDENEWYPWPYNEAIGWIQISIYGTEIKGELYFVKAKKIRRVIKKCFRWAGELFEIEVFPNDSSSKIYNGICARLEEFRSEKRYRKLHVDTEAFRNIGCFVDWRGLVNFYRGKSAEQSAAIIIPEVHF
jgi:hypothetical protein